MTTKEFKINLLPLKNKLFRMSLNLLNNRDDAEDAVQEVYIKIWKMQHKINSVKNTEAFMMTVARNHCLDKLKSKRERFISLNDNIINNVNSASSDANEQTELVDKVKHVIKQLPEQQRTIVHLRDIEGYDYDEIGEITGWDLNYLRVNLSRGRKKIKETILKLQHYEATRN